MADESHEELKKTIKREKYQLNASTTLNESSASNRSDVENLQDGLQPTIFDVLHQDCLDELFDWLPLATLCTLSKTCRSLKRMMKTYFHRKYPSQEFTIGDEFVFIPQHFEHFSDVVQCLLLYDTFLPDFEFVGTCVNQNLREIEFVRTYPVRNNITKDHIDGLRNILQNVKTIRAVKCKFEDDCAKYLLENSKSVEDFAFTIFKDLKKTDFQLNKSPTLRNIEIYFHRNANVMEAMNFIKGQNVQLSELVLAFTKEHTVFLKWVFDQLRVMYENRYFKRLYLVFDEKSMVVEHIDMMASMQGLEGVGFSYTVCNDVNNHMAVIAKLQNIKFFYINLLLDNADVISQQLQELEEIEISVATIDAIFSFVRYSAKLTRFHINHIRPKQDVSSKFDAAALNDERAKLKFSRKLIIYIPEDKFIKLKWSSVAMTSSLVEIRREESCIPLKKD